MLRLENVTLERGRFSLSANLAVEGPGVTAVIGPSGGGKSTFLALIAGFLLPDAGDILWQSRSIARLLPGERPVATLFQDNNLFPHLDVLTNVALGVSPTGKVNATARDKVSDVLSRVGLAGFERRMPSELSGGQQGRVALARILLTERPIVLMDEPFSALGPAQRRDMLSFVCDLLADATVLMVTHDPEDARIARDTILVADGEVRPPQDTKDLFQNPPPALEAYLA